VIRVTAQTEAAERILVALRDGLTPENLDPIVERVALQSLAGLVAASPKRWFGQIRSGWEVRKPAEGSRELDIPASKVGVGGQKVRDIALWVDQGTANDGAGFIYPVRAKLLYIPLTRRAAGGWQPGLQRGVDYVLAPRVRGIKGRQFIAPQRAKAFERLRAGLRNYIVSLVRTRRR
jgi:hypothetical protein